MPNNWSKQRNTTLAFSTHISQDFDNLVINLTGQELWCSFTAAAYKLHSSVLKEKCNVTKSWVAVSALFSHSFPQCLTSPAMYSQPVSHSTDHFTSMHYSENIASAFNTEISELTNTTTFKQLCQVMFIEHSYCNITEVVPWVWYKQCCSPVILWLVLFSNTRWFSGYFCTGIRGTNIRVATFPEIFQFPLRIFWMLVLNILFWTVD